MQIDRYFRGVKYIFPLKIISLRVVIANKGGRNTTAPLLGWSDHPKTPDRVVNQL